MKKIINFFKNRYNNIIYKDKKFESEDEFYTYLFTKNPSWNSSEPNEDESIRWSEIEKEVKNMNLNRSTSDILEIGCGRGWLCNKLSHFGNITGIEPVEPVVNYAKKMFPSISFYALLPGPFLKQYPNKKFDLIVSTEVLEHVNDKPGFMSEILEMLKPNGKLLITTPRIEHFDDFIKVYGWEPNQPYEDWLSEDQVKQLLLDSKFEILSKKFFAPLPIKESMVNTTQMWVAKKI